MCIRENFWIDQPHNGKRVKARWLFAIKFLSDKPPYCVHK
jgi:hypothetical protein